LDIPRNSCFQVVAVFWGWRSFDGIKHTGNDKYWLIDMAIYVLRIYHDKGGYGEKELLIGLLLDKNITNIGTTSARAVLKKQKF